MSDMPERSEDDFNPATMADDVIYVGARKYVASDLPHTREQIMADERVQALVEVIDMLDQCLFDRMYVKGQYVVRRDAVAKARTALAALTESP